MRDAIQTLCKNADPLGRTMDYVQEDLDSMRAEFNLWKQEVTKNLAVYKQEKV